MIGRGKRVLAIFFLLLFNYGIQVLSADSILEEVDRIFSQELDNQEYILLRYQIKSIFSDLEKMDLPVNSLLDKLKEGFAKGIPPARLLEAIKLEAQRIVKAEQLLQKSRFPLLTNKENEEIYKNLSLFLLGGLSDESLVYLLSLVKIKENRVKIFNSLGSTILNIKSVTNLKEEDLMPLAKVLFESELNPNSFFMISSLFIKAKLRRLSDEEMLNLVINVLSRGGGILQIEEELSRRTRGR